MTTPKLPLVNDKGQILARNLRRVGREVEAHSRLTVGGGLTHQMTAGGPIVTDPRPEEILVRIVSGTNPYVWQQLYSDYDPATNTIAYPDHLEGSSGTLTDLPLFEINANRVIAPGTRAFATLSDDGEAYVITRCCGLPFASGSGDGSLIVTPCCPNGLPASLSASFGVTSGACACLDGQVIPVGWNGVEWFGETALCGVTVSVAMYCVEFGPGNSTMYLSVTIGSATTTTAVGPLPAGEFCDPAAFSYGVTVGGNAAGNPNQQYLATLCGGDWQGSLTVTA